MLTIAEKIKVLIEDYRDTPEDYDLDKVVVLIIEIATKEMREALKDLVWDLKHNLTFIEEVLAKAKGEE